MISLLEILWEEFRSLINLILGFVGFFYFVWIIWGVLSKYEGTPPTTSKRRRSSHDYTSSVHKQVNNVIRLKEEMKSIMSNGGHQNDDQVFEDQEGNQDENNDRIKKLGLEFQGMCDQLVRELTAFHGVALQKSEENNKGNFTNDVNFKEIMDAMQSEIRELKEIIQKGEAASMNLQEVNFVTIQEIRGTFDRVFTQFKNIILDKYEDLEVMIMEKDLLSRTHIAEFEIGYVSKFGHELEVLRHQQEDEFLDVHPTVFLWKISGFENKMQNLLQVEPIHIVSLDYFNVANGLQVKPILKINAYRENVVVNLEIIFDPLLRENVVPPPFLHYRKYVLLDQSSELHKEHIELTDRPYFRMITTEDMMLPHFNCLLLCCIRLLDTNGKYVKNDEVLIKVVLEPISMASVHVASNDGVLMWRIDRYATRKQEEIDVSKPRLISEPFRTSENGYHMQLELFLNGSDGAVGEYISIFVQFLLGGHDTLLPFPFRAKISFYLMDQSESEIKNDVCKELEDCEVNQDVLDCGYTEFVLQRVVEGPQYLKNDTLLLKAVIKIL